MIPRWLRSALSVLLATAALACGDDAVIIFSTNLGTIESDATCSASGGTFPLRQQQGLVIIVAIDSDSAIILASGNSGGCRDLVAGARANVRGVDEGDRFHASEVRILD